MIYMSQQEGVHRAVPIAGELVPRDRVPPVRIEATVCKSGDFGQCIELVIGSVDRTRTQAAGARTTHSQIT